MNKGILIALFSLLVQVLPAQQLARPIGDVSIGSWTDGVGGTTNIYQSIDEVTANDNTDYIEASAVNTTADFNITSVTDPGIHTGHIIKFRMWAQGSGAPERCEMQIWQGTSTQIASSGTQSSRGAWATKTYTLSDVEAGNITDYTDLNVRIISSNLAATEIVRVTWVEVEIPNASTSRRIFISGN